MSPLRCRLLAVIVLLFPASAAAQTTAFLVQSEPGDTIGTGVTQTWTDADATFAVTRNARNGISVAIEKPSNLPWLVELSLPGAATITPGHYTGATRFPSTPFVGMSVTGAGHTCNQLTGRYLVRDVAYGPSGSVLRLAVDVEQHCEDAPPALFAALRINSTVPMDLFPDDTARYRVSMTTSDGGLVTGGGLACGAGQTACVTTFTSPGSITLTATPLHGYIFNGWSGGCSGGAVTTLVVNTVKECRAAFATEVPTQPRTRLAFTSGPNDPVGSGRSGVYTFANSEWTVETAGNGQDLTFTIDAPGPLSEVRWTLAFRSAAGSPLAPGYYPNAVRAPVRTTTPGLEFSGDRSCSTLTGEFTVYQYDRDPVNGSVLAFGADFLQYCGGQGDPPLRGRVEYWSTHGIPAPCLTPDPFAAIGGGTCFNGGWLPPGMIAPTPPTTPPTTPPPPSGTCTGADPFAAMGGGVCHDGGWLPPGITPPRADSTPTPTPPAPTPTSCATADPFAAIGGGTCYNGGWLPPGMSPPGNSTPPGPTPPPTPPVSTCTTPDPFVAIGGGTCFAGGWLPPGMPIPGGGG